MESTKRNMTDFYSMVGAIDVIALEKWLSSFIVGCLKPFGILLDANI